MQHTYPEALIIATLAAVFVAWLFLRHKAQQRRMEIVHAERLAAMDKGVPLPELPVEPAKAPPDPRAPLLHGIVWFSLGLGGVVALLLMGPLPDGQAVWMMPMPLVYLGAGLILYYVLGPRKR